MATRDAGSRRSTVIVGNRQSAFGSRTRWSSLGGRGRAPSSVSALGRSTFSPWGRKQVPTAGFDAWGKGAFRHAY
jgi:hypothetical protein